MSSDKKNICIYSVQNPLRLGQHVVQDFIACKCSAPRYNLSAVLSYCPIILLLYMQRKTCWQEHVWQFMSNLHLWIAHIRAHCRWNTFTLKGSTYSHANGRRSRRTGRRANERRKSSTGRERREGRRLHAAGGTGESTACSFYSAACCCIVKGGCKKSEHPWRRMADARGWKTDTGTTATSQTPMERT